MRRMSASIAGLDDSDDWQQKQSVVIDSGTPSSDEVRPSKVKQASKPVSKQGERSHAFSPAGLDD
jgi:hypothetical protein